MYVNLYTTLCVLVLLAHTTCPYLSALDCKIADNWPRHRQPAGLVLVSDGHHDARRPARRMPGGYLQEVRLRRSGSFAGVHVLVSERRGNGRGARTVQQTRSA